MFNLLDSFFCAHVRVSFVFASIVIWISALQICAVLYPGDATEGGKLLRLKQQFFLCSASLQVG